MNGEETETPNVASDPQQEAQKISRVSNLPSTSSNDIQKVSEDIGILYVKVEALTTKAESALTQADRALKGVDRIEPILYLGFFISIILLLTLCFVAWPVFSDYFLNSALYQAQIQEKMSTSNR